ncbi:CiaD-like domain-containing protein [Sulfurospirillum sp.]|uniref:CiaD-like domain-containing protein n=1 Tax=Sulfurospirillum sp. TaxID=2053622 RepID=UPI002FDEEA2F
MELKDMILSTLKELEEVVPKEEQQQQQTLQPPRKRESEEISFEPEPLLEITEEISMIQAYAMSRENDDVEDESCVETQKQFYMNLRERILVLFEGFQSPNNKNIEAKIDLTLNFLEYLLATIDEQLEHMDNLKK